MAIELEYVNTVEQFVSYLKTKCSNFFTRVENESAEENLTIITCYGMQGTKFLKFTVLSKLDSNVNYAAIRTLDVYNNPDAVTGQTVINDSVAASSTKKYLRYIAKSDNGILIYFGKSVVDDPTSVGTSPKDQSVYILVTLDNSGGTSVVVPSSINFSYWSSLKTAYTTPICISEYNALDRNSSNDFTQSNSPTWQLFPFTFSGFDNSTKYSQYAYRVVSLSAGFATVFSVIEDEHKNRFMTNGFWAVLE